MNRFQNLLSRTSTGLIPFFVLGYPTLESSLKLIEAALEMDIAGLELGFPFSDPMADGPVIQKAMEVALQTNNSWFDYCHAITEIRQKTSLPIGLLVYSNLLHRQGFSQAITDLKQAGVDGILSVDIPLEEQHILKPLLANHALGLINLVAPNTPEQRAKTLIMQSSAFAYILSRLGTTGARDALPEELLKRLALYRNFSLKTPLVVGFGISQKTHLDALSAAGAHAAIVGSALISVIENNSGNIKKQCEQIRQFLSSLILEKNHDNFK